MSSILLSIAFRADASVYIGTGHVMRCLTLASALKEQGAKCHFICREHPGNLIELIRRRGFEVHSLPMQTQNADSDGGLQHAAWLGCSQAQDAEVSKEILHSLKPDWLIVDHYALDENWENAARLYSKRIMVIDDLADRSHNCEILLDQNLGRKPKDYDALVPEICERLIGPHYALLRPEFAELREQSLKRRKSANLKRILVTLGGIDRTNMTGRVLEALAKAKLPASTLIDVVMGATAPHLQAVKEQAEGLPYKVSVSVNVTDMAKRMCQADLAIGAAGSTAWERCCLGLPSYTIVLAKNQQKIAEALSIASATQIVDSQSTINNVLCDRELLLSMSSNAAQICDGKGTDKVCVRIISIDA